MPTIDTSAYKAIFTNRAYNAIIAESKRMSPKETGGNFMGYFLDTGYWVVMEVLLPGPRSEHNECCFEYDDKYLNYTAKGISAQYEHPIEVIGLWHRHPGSMDVFSGMDGKTNSDFAARFTYGAISALVNFDPSFRLTLYHVSPQPVFQTPLSYVKTCVKNAVSSLSQRQTIPTPKYTKIEHWVGDDLIPSHLFQLRYYPPKEKQTTTTNCYEHTDKTS